MNATRKIRARLLAVAVAALTALCVERPENRRRQPGLTMPALPITPVVRSDTDGLTETFTRWMAATQGSAWTAYCQSVGLLTGSGPCPATTGYPIQGGTDMIGQPGDPGVATYVAQSSSTGAIGYVPYYWALQEGFPAAKVLNAAGYYTQPFAANVGVSLLDAQFNADGSADLSPVYADTDPRAYELSYYSYMIVPTDLSDGMSTAVPSPLASRSARRSRRAARAWVTSQASWRPRTAVSAAVSGQARSART